MSGFWAGFWLLATIASVAWYLFLVLYVGWKGGKDIGTMIARLRAQGGEDEGPRA